MSDRHPQEGGNEISVPASEKKQEEKAATGRFIEIGIRLAALALLLFWCINILLPFGPIAIWGIVLAIALYPAFKGLKRILRGKGTLAAVLLGVLFLAILIGPAVWLTISTGTSLEHLAENIKSGEITVPPPSEQVKTIPLVGKPIYDAWSLGYTNMQQLIQQYKTQIVALTKAVIGLVASTGKGLLLFILSIVVSVVLLIYAKSAGDFGRSLFVRLLGDTRGTEMASLAEVTVRNVTRGILGVAFIQSLLAGIGMLILGVPLAGLWTLACLVLAIVQIGILPVSIGVIIYAWTSMSTTSAIILTAWMLFVGVVDNILKPIMLGKGAPVPMLVVFLGAIGGFIYSGFIGLFTGAIVLSLGYKLFIAWMKEG